MLYRNNLTTPSVVCRAPFDAGRGAFDASNQVDGEAREGRGEAPLGRYTVNVDQRGDAAARVSPKKEHQKEKKDDLRKAYRRALYADQRAAAAIVGEHVRHDHRVCKCKWVKCAASVDLVENTYLSDAGETVVRAGFKGVTICGNPWACPVCGDRIARKRRDEMNMAMSWGRSEGLVPVLMTLTARHGFEDSLEDLLEAMKKAKRRLRQRKEWKTHLPLEGSISATEMTHGKNGWHPHFHEIVFLKADNEAHALELMRPLENAWLVSLAAFGLDGNAAAFDVRGASQAGDYITKFGVSEEMSMREGKQSKGGGRIPRELARAAAAGGKGSKQAEMLWLEYFKATSGKRRKLLTWSHGLKARVGVDEVSDEDAALEDGDGQEPAVAEPLRRYDNQTWRQVRPRRVRILEAAETGDLAEIASAETGPDDGQDEDDFDLIDDEAVPLLKASPDYPQKPAKTAAEILDDALSELASIDLEPTSFDFDDALDDLAALDPEFGIYA